ncbi:MAG: YigZ family protein [Schwartzia sp.]|nr:YigZ family protein [Schwartzia sp. (in: firmicutes)]
MSKNEPLTILKNGQAEFTVQRSRFIAYAAAVRDEEEARAFIARLRKEHYDARHCCSAWILGADGAKQKSSDDGEPGGTAGMPILEVMKRRGLTDAAVAVVRYFGGIKLGAGGLVRAYSHAASIGIDAATLARRVTLRRLDVTVSYDLLSAVERWARQKNLRTGEAVYAENVALPIFVEPEACDAAKKELADLTSAKAVVEDGDEVELLEPVEAAE